MESGPPSPAIPEWAQDKNPDKFSENQSIPRACQAEKGVVKRIQKRGREKNPDKFARNHPPSSSQPRLLRHLRHSVDHMRDPEG